MKKKTIERVIEPIDVNDDELMVALGIRCPNAESRDPEVWTKTDKEKKLLRKLRNRKYNFGPNIGMNTCFHLYDKLIIRIKKHPKFKTKDSKLNIDNYKTTFSIKCYQHDIPRLLNQFKIYNKEGILVNDLVIKYTWNGKTYNSSNVLPYRGW